MSETAEQRRRNARERKQRSRDKRSRMEMRPMRLELSAAEREEIEAMAAHRGFDAVAEYIFWLVRADRGLMECNPKLNPAADAVTRHVREFSARCDTPDIGEAV